MELENNYTVYMHISPSNKRYIGITCQEVEKRWKNGKGYNNNKYFTSAINKYGWDNFQHIIIAKGLTEDVAKWLEIELIREWDSVNRDKGYNITKGGESANGLIHTEEWKQELSKKMSGENHPMFGKCHTEKTKEKISKKMSRENHPNYGKTLSEKTRKKMSENHYDCSGENNPMFGKGYLKKGENNYWYGLTRPEHSKRMSGEKNPRAKMVICITTMKIFSTSKEGAKYYGVKNNGDIGQCCRGKLKSCGKTDKGDKLVWLFLEDFLNKLLIIEL